MVLLYLYFLHGDINEWRGMTTWQGAIVRSDSADLGQNLMSTISDESPWYFFSWVSAGNGFSWSQVEFVYKKFKVEARIGLTTGLQHQFASDLHHLCIVWRIFFYQIRSKIKFITGNIVKIILRFPWKNSSACQGLGCKAMEMSLHCIYSKCTYDLIQTDSFQAP